MNSLLWIAVAVMAFFAGYFVRGITEQSQAIAMRSMQSLHTPSTLSNEEVNRDVKSYSSAQAVTTPKTTSLTFSSSSVIASVATASKPWQGCFTGDPSSVSSAGENPATVTFPGEISDEAVDKIVPAPFNTQLENTHGILREKYQSFFAVR